MKTRITELFGIEYPIQCGGMLWIATPELAAAISNTGAMGNLTSGNYNTADELGKAIDQTRALTAKPFIVNITTMPSIKVREAVSLPMLAAGGMADGKSLAAALALGADGIMMATRFLATRESGVHENIYQVLIEKTESDTVLQLSVNPDLL